MRSFNKRNRRRDAVLDLTSLLDVIFIVLLLVMSRQQLISEDNAAVKEKLNKEIEAQQELKEDASEIVGVYNMEMEMHESINAYAPCVCVYANYLDNNPSERHIRVKVGDSEIQSPYNLYADKTATVYEEFTNDLRAFIEENQDKPVLLSLNEGDENILYRDEVQILEIFDSLKDEYENVYIK